MIDFDVPEYHDSLPGIPPPPATPFLIGHEHVRRMLAEAYRAGRLHHALLFDGPQGVGKATLAFHLVQHILSHRPGPAAPDIIGDVDPAAPAFRQVAQNAHPALLYLTRPRQDSGNGFKSVLSVDEIRRINRFFSLTASDGLHRIVIVDAAGDMNRNAANALLKNLEEPPRGALFILISHGAVRLLPTIRSRCQTIRFYTLSNDQVKAATERITGEPASPAAVRHAEGSVRQALLFAGFGGADLAAAFDAILAAPTLPTPASHALASAVAARGDETPFRLFSEHAMMTLRATATAAARSGRLARANRLSETEAQLAERLRAAAAYNLDRKQEALQVIATVHAAVVDDRG